MIDGRSSQRYVPAAPPFGLAFTACQVQHARATVELTRHPCQLAAHFLPCARPPDICWPHPTDRAVTRAPIPDNHIELSSPLAPVSTRTRAFGGLNPREGFLPLPSEGYHISKARTSSMADLPLLRKFPLCIRAFYFRCSRTHPHFWERISSV
jgi:hypothetical protein